MHCTLTEELLYSNMAYSLHCAPTMYSLLQPPGSQMQVISLLISLIRQRVYVLSDNWQHN